MIFQTQLWRRHAQLILRALLTLALSAAPTLVAEINLRGLGNSISNNDLTPSTTDGTFFGVVTLGDGQTLERTFTIENTDTFLSILNLDGSPPVSIGGEHPQDFSVTVEPDTILFNGESTTFTVAFAPTAGGIRNAVITIPNDDSNEDPYTFAIQATAKLALNYNAGVGGSITGNASQSVFSTQNGSPVTLVEKPGYLFIDWSDGDTSNPRQDLNVTENISVAARYLKYSSSGTEITITDCNTGLSGVFAVPATIGGLPVTGIGNDAFWRCSKLTEITLPTGITGIGNDAFHSCRALETLVLPDSVASIGESAFESCARLETINVPDGITEIGRDTFKHSGLTNLVLPNSVTSIRSGAFAYCSSLETFAIPSQVTEIERDLFSWCTALTTVSLPSGLTSIGFQAFFECWNLENVVLPASLTSIGEWAFARCRSLTSLTIPPGVTTIEYAAFEFCEDLVSVTLPPGLTAIETNAFRVCTSLTTITIPPSVTTIDYSAFGDCYKLREFILQGDEAPMVEEGAFTSGSGHPDASITVANPQASGYVYGATFDGLPVTGLDPNADPYNTGVSNLLTYAFFGTAVDPATVRPSDLPQHVIENNRLLFRFPTHEPSDISFRAESSPTPDGPWNELPDEDPVSGFYQFSIPLTGTGEFLRLKVVELP